MIINADSITFVKFSNIAISSSQVLGPFFFEGNLTGASYLDMLATYVVQLERLPNFTSLSFQQDRAPPHFACKIRNYLDTILGDHWIGRRGGVERPLRSPDMTRIDFFFWEVVKDFVFKTLPLNFEQMKERIFQAFDNIWKNLNICQKVCRSVVDRCDLCTAAE